MLLQFCSLSCILLSGCTLPESGDEEPVLISSIYQPVQYVKLWRIEYGFDFSGKKSFLTQDAENLCINIKKNEISYILAYPLKEDGTEAGLPFGAIMPYSRTLTEQDGFASSILCNLYCKENEYILNHFNWQKFMEQCREYENPWLLDRDRIQQAILKGKFKKSDIKPTAK